MKSNDIRNNNNIGKTHVINQNFQATFWGGPSSSFEVVDYGKVPQHDVEKLPPAMAA